MHKLARQVRFSINPFLAEDSVGFNSFSSRPAGEGLAIFLELYVGLLGEVEPATGFVVNVVDIDKNVTEYVVPIFAGGIRKYFRQGKHIGFSEIIELLQAAGQKLKGKFKGAKLAELSLLLNPFRKIAIDCEGTQRDCKMAYFSEKFEFAAMHRLWNSDFSDERNREVFGKCANPAGHGHNYTAEVTIKAPAAGESFCVGDFEKIVTNEFIELVDHKNLNVDVEEFKGVNPTVENITVFAWEKLAGKFGEATLHCVTVWETDKTCSSYYG